MLPFSPPLTAATAADADCGCPLSGGGCLPLSSRGLLLSSSSRGLVDEGPPELRDWRPEEADGLSGGRLLCLGRTKGEAPRGAAAGPSIRGEVPVPRALPVRGEVAPFPGAAAVSMPFVGAVARGDMGAPGADGDIERGDVEGCICPVN